MRNPDRFRGSPAGKVVEVTNEGIGPSPYHAFVPSPLPPRLAITTFRDALQGVRGSVSGPRLADSLFETPFVTVRAAAKLLDASDRTARLAVERLVDVGILTPGTRTRRRRGFRFSRP